MDFRKLKELAKKMGGILVMDGDKPEFIILPYEKYSETSDDERHFSSEGGDKNASGADENEQKNIDDLNREILALKEEIRQKESAELVDSTESEDVTSELVDFN
ncbi:MAG: hypothetical protein WD898_02020 [Candidatus Paceibacterota bacterium]